MTVEWEEAALDRLADFYVAVTSEMREVIAAGIERINVQLARDPHELGEDRGPGRRDWFSAPLVVVYDLLEGGLVLVIHVSLLSRSFRDD